MTPLKKISAYVFVTGSAVMILEMATFRILTPVFGSSTIVWGMVLGTIMIALALGYRIGGLVGDRWAHVKTLMWIGLIAGLYTSLIPIILIPVLDLGSLQEIFIGDVDMKMMLLGLLVSIIVFTPGVFILGMIAPVALRVVTRHKEDAGPSSGVLYSASTVGSIFGTYLAAFFLIPFIGPEVTVFSTAVVLCVVSLVGLYPNYKPIALILVPIASMLFWFWLPSEEVIFETQSLYNDLRVIDQGNGSVGLVMNEGIGVHSVYNPDSIWSLAYWDSMSMIPIMLEAEDVTILGTAGGTIPRTLKALDPDIKITGVEIDPAFEEIARDYFGDPLQEVDMYYEDARQFIQGYENAADILMMDAYGKDAYVPFHLATKEFFQESKTYLKDDGILAFNLVSWNDETQLYKAIVATVQDVFPYVYSYKVIGSVNYIILASDQELEWARVDFDDYYTQEMSKLLQTTELAPWTDGTILTDNRAPVEYLTETLFIDVFTDEDEE